MKTCLKRAASFAVLFAVLTAQSWAGGSLSFAEIRPLIEKSGSFGQWLLERFEFSDNATGVRLGNHWPHLGGARQGPYTVKGKFRGDPGRMDLLFTIGTRVAYYDGTSEIWSGRALAESLPNSVFEATDFSETLKSVEIRIRPKAAPAVEASPDGQ